MENDTQDITTVDSAVPSPALAGKCAHVDERGQCRAYSQVTSAYCFTHDPAKAETRANARKKGGMNSRQRSRLNVEPPSNAEDAKKINARVLASLLSGELDERTAQIAGQLIGSFLKAHDMSEAEEAANKNKKGRQHGLSEGRSETSE